MEFRLQAVFRRPAELHLPQKTRLKAELQTSVVTNPREAKVNSKQSARNSEAVSVAALRFNYLTAPPLETYLSERLGQDHGPPIAATGPA